MIRQALVSLEEALPKITGTTRLDLQWPLVSGSEAPYPPLTPRQVKRAIKTLGGFGAPAATPSTVGNGGRAGGRSRCAQSNVLMERRRNCRSDSFFRQAWRRRLR